VISLAQKLGGRIKDVLGGKVRGGTGVAAPTDVGRLDRGFGVRGLVSTSFHGEFGDEANAVVIQLDGKIVAVGRGDGRAYYDFVLARYDASGRLDASFGTSGLVRTAFGARGDSDASAAALQPDGRIVAAGDHKAGRHFEFALARYKANGSLDRSFGTGGRVVTAFSPRGGAQASAVALQADGKIVAAGLHRIGKSTEFALARYDTTGRLDPTFGSGGKVLTAFAPNSDDEAGAVAIQRDGRIVVVGSHRQGDRFTFALASYTSTGRLDPSFGGGRLTTKIGSASFASALAIQPDGDLVAAGREFLPVTGFALARYKPNGSLDANFGVCGTATTPFAGGGFPSVSGLAIQPDGKLVAAGSDPLNVNGFLLARYNRDGSLDPSFGTAAGATDPKDRGYEFALARFLG
jgi:uncharacterized delta-60 repeat protein